MRTQARRRRRSAVARVLVGTAAVVVLAGAGGLVVAMILDRVSAAPLVARCSALTDGTPRHLAPDQAETAALLVGQSIQREMPARAATIAIATGLQESRLRNIDYGDRDSVGIFQQRPSQGWGTVEQIMDPVYSTTAFYDALHRVPGYQGMEITVAAQTVQRSGFPDAYAQHESVSRAWASALTGHSPSALTCTLPAADEADPEGLVARLGRDLGLVATVDDGVLQVDAGALPGSTDDAARKGWALAHWAVAVAEPFGVVAVHVGDAAWERGGDGWATGPEVLVDGEVRVVMATG